MDFAGLVFVFILLSTGIYVWRTALQIASGLVLSILMNSSERVVFVGAW